MSWPLDPVVQTAALLVGFTAAWLILRSAVQLRQLRRLRRERDRRLQEVANTALRAAEGALAAERKLAQAIRAVAKRGNPVEMAMVLHGLADGFEDERMRPFLRDFLGPKPAPKTGQPN